MQTRNPGLVVATDLVVPRLPSPLVARPRLFEILDRGVEDGVLTLVCAHAGTGKTVLLSSWAATQELPGRLAWLTLRRHAGEATFWAQLAAALSAIVPPSSGLAQLDPPHGTASTAFLNRLLNGFAELDSPVILVLDDFHTAPPGLAGRIATLLHGAPEQLRLVLASRTDPRLPLHLLRLSGELTEIRAADLALTIDEAEPLLEGLEGWELRTAVDWTEGWAAGIRLLALSLRDQGDRGGRVARFAAEGRTVADYLATEVLAAQPQELRLFLLRTSIVDRLTGDLADALTGGVDGDRTLARLLRDNLFIDQPAEDGGGYRYHRLFAELLRAEARVELRAELPALYERAARWQARHGDPVEAVRLALTAGDWELATELLGEHWFAVCVAGDTEIAGSLIEGVPPAYRRASPLLTALTAVLRLSLGASQRAESQLEAAALGTAEVPAELRPTLQEILAHGQLLATRLRGDSKGTIRLARARLQELSSSSLTTVEDEARRSLALTALGAALLWDGTPDQAGKPLEQACELARDAGLLCVELDALSQLALLELVRGRLRRAVRLARHAIDTAEEQLGGCIHVVAAHCALALTAQLHGDLDTAEREAARARELARGAGDAAGVGLACLAEALVALSRGGEPAERSLRRLRALRGDVGVLAGPWLRPLAIATEARLLASGEQPGEAATVLRQGLESFAGDPVLLLARARLELAAGDSAGAAATLDEEASQVAERPLRIQALVLEAVAARARHDGEQALRALAEALTLAEPEAVRQPFLDCGPVVQELLAELLRSGSSHRWLAGELVRAFDGRTGGRKGPAELLDPLSEREQEVLHYLPTMLSNSDIAAELFVSVNTVKTHVKSIYRKLGASKRQDAVHRARQLHLI